MASELVDAQTESSQTAAPRNPQHLGQTSENGQEDDQTVTDPWEHLNILSLGKLKSTRFTLGCF